IFWSRWREEYLTLLQQRSKWRTSKPALQVNDVVLDNLPPQQWLLGRIVARHTGEDGMVRVVDVRTSGGGVFRRAIHKLAPHPIS
ncbi:hypothetical protein KR084_007573, partial [Drosophila pseudotakahashii]